MALTLPLPSTPSLSLMPAASTYMPPRPPLLPKSKSLPPSSSSAPHIPPSLLLSPHLLSPASAFRHHHTLAELHDRDARYDAPHDELHLLDTIPIGSAISSSPYQPPSVVFVDPQRAPVARRQSTGSHGGSEYWAELGHDLHDLRGKYTEVLEEEEGEAYPRTEASGRV